MSVLTAFLDTTLLGMITNPSPKSPISLQIKEWVRQMDNAGHRLIVPAVADYEVRREHLRRNAPSSIVRLDSFVNKVEGRYLPLTDSALKRAALLWADLRRRGLSTADAKSLDCDLVLAAQVLDLELPPQSFVVVTSNVAHLSRVVPCDTWQNIVP